MAIKNRDIPENAGKIAGKIEYKWI